MANACAFIFTIFLYVTSILIFLASSLGFLIYNGIFWGSINGLYNEIPLKYGHLNQLWKLSLSSWILGIILPFGGPVIPSILIAVWTTPSECTNGKQLFIDAVHDNTSFTEVWNKYLFENSDPSEIVPWEKSHWFRNWFDERCKKPHLLNTVFLGMVGYVFFAHILTKIISSITNRDSNEGKYETLE